MEINYLKISQNYLKLLPIIGNNFKLQGLTSIKNQKYHLKILKIFSS